MSNQKSNLIDLDINKVFVELRIDEIEEIEKLLCAEIEKKRTQLRSMVGDRYKDILITSDSIKSMKNISNQIVESIENVSDSCKILLEDVDSIDEKTMKEADEAKISERTLVIQIKLAMDINEGIWMNIDKEDYLNAAQLYLLGQNIHTGLHFSNFSNMQKVPLLKHIENNLITIKGMILDKIIKKLESVELTSEQACRNLNGLLLLQNQNTDQLISIFMDHRKAALNTVLNNSHSSVRSQISTMMKCLITTIHLLYDCFICSGESKRGLIFQQLEEIVNSYAFSILFTSKMQKSTLDSYIPKMIKEFKPLCKIPPQDEQTFSNILLEKWLEDTKSAVKLGLQKMLELVTSIKGLHIIREEALKIEPPSNWEEICNSSINLPQNFNVWLYFFQTSITERARILISNKMKQNLEIVKNSLEDSLKKNSNDEINELDLRSSVWSEDARDIERLDNQYTGISLRAMGFSKTVLKLCETFDEQFRGLLQDQSQYLYGVEFDGNVTNLSLVLGDNRSEKKFVDVDILHKGLVKECVFLSKHLIQYIANILNGTKCKSSISNTLFCARLLKAITKLCPYFKKACCLSGSSEDWHEICNNFDKQSVILWRMWIDYTLIETRKMCLEKFKSFTYGTTLSMFFRWENIEIQEQTEDKTFKSNIRIPLKPSAALESILLELNQNLCRILLHTLPKMIHAEYIERNASTILQHYKEMPTEDFNQNQALQFLFDVKFLNTFCITRDNGDLVAISQEVCDRLRSKIDPFDLDVFYSYLQANVKRAVVQSEIILGCLLPSYMQIANLDISDRTNREHEKEPSILAVSSATNGWFSLLPLTIPAHKSFDASPQIEGNSQVKTSLNTKTNSTVRSNTASLFGGLKTDWFS